MKRIGRCIAIAGMLCTILCCSACGTRPLQTEQTTSSEALQTAYVEREGKTGVVVCDSTMTDCFTLADADIGVPSVKQTKIMEGELQGYALSAGDIVLILDKQQDQTKVMLPYGDPPSIYGYLSSETISTEQEDISSGNQANVMNCMTYDALGGAELGEMSAGVAVLSREGEWCQVQSLGTGEEPVWVHAEQLLFDFDRSVLDTAE